MTQEKSTEIVTSELKEKNKGGRPTIYNPKRHPLIIMGAIAMGIVARDKISELCGIGESTLYDWEDKHEAVYEALRSGGELDPLLMSTELRLALGYNYTEEAVAKGLGIVELQKYQAPNYNALQTVMKRRGLIPKEDKGNDDLSLQEINIELMKLLTKMGINKLD